MYLRRTLPAPAPRRGVILLVVLAMLTLFAILGLAFVLYSQAEATSSRIFREAQFRVEDPPDENPTTLFRWLMAQLIYDVPDDDAGAASALRGHSLARTMYGFNSNALNILPFNGPGRLNYTSPVVAGQNERDLINYMYFQGDGFVRDPERLGARANPGVSQLGVPPNPPPNPHTNGHNAPYTAADLNTMALAAVRAFDRTANPAPPIVLQPSFHRHWLFNPGMTFNDQSNPNWRNPEGKYKLLRPRPIDQKINPADPTEQELFPYPEDATGDVKNLVGAPGGNDSVWIDLGYDVKTAADGTLYKPLFAFLVMDLDNRVNLNVHGNVLGGTAGPPDTRTHRSNQGWGKWEVNPAHVVNNPAGPNEWRNAMIGRQTSPTARVQGRYGPNQIPQGVPLGLTAAIPGPTPRFTAQVDFNGGLDDGTGNPTPRLQLPSAATNPTSLYPLFGVGYGNTSQPERTAHALLYDYFRSPPPFVTITNLNPPPPNLGLRPHDDVAPLAALNMKQLLYESFTSLEFQQSVLATLMPQNFQVDNQINRRTRGLVTTHSMDWARPGLAPWLYDRNAAASRLQTNPTSPELAPVGAAATFPDPVTQRMTPVPAGSDFRTPGLNPSGRPIDSQGGIDWRAADAALGRLDLNRFLAPYPHLGRSLNALPGGGFLSGQGFYQPNPLVGVDNSTSPPTVQPFVRFDINDPSGAVQAQFAFAQQGRQQLARDVYVRLLSVTGAPSIQTPANPQDAELMPRRWLAQLAANIVDFIDEDNVSTPFNFYGTQDGLPAAQIGDLSSKNPELPKFWVFGTELPKVVLNEVFTEYKLPQNPPPGQNPITVKVWAELYNTTPAFPPATAVPPGPAVQQRDTVPEPLHVPSFSGSGQGYSAYRVVVANTVPGNQGGPLMPRPLPTGGFNNDNVLGAPDTIRPRDQASGQPVVVDFPAQIGTFSTPNGTTTQALIDRNNFCLVGPQADQGSDTPRNTIPPAGPATANLPMYISTGMQYEAQYVSPGGTFQPPQDFDPTPGAGGVTVVLRRLANPHLPFNPQILLPSGQPNPFYNPYVTIDHLEHVRLNNATNQNTPLTSRSKRQPFASHFNPNDNLSQVASQPNTTQTTVHTFGQPNAPAVQPSGGAFNWLTHLDRPLVSPMELLQVSGYKPHQLTHRFIVDNTTQPLPYAQRVPWLDNDAALGLTPLAADQSHRLWRFFEMVQTADRAQGISAHGRTPGKININTVYDPETLLALCDPQLSNGFTPAEIANPANPLDPNTVYGRLLALRTPGMANPNPPAGVDPALYSFGPTDKPFLGMGTGISVAPDPQSQTGYGLNDTLLRSASGGDGTTPRLFQTIAAPDAHPYLQMELMNKIFNNVTTRSNVFAVWCTVGFFEVTDETAVPPKLGTEIGRSQGDEIRHRFFCIVDRTNIMVQGRRVNNATTTTATPTFVLRSQQLPAPVAQRPGPGAVTANMLNQPVWVRVAAARANGNLPDLGFTPFTPPGPGGRIPPGAEGTLSGLTNQPSPIYPRGFVPWQIGPGTVLVVDVGVQQETIVVNRVRYFPDVGTTPAAVDIEAVFTKTHIPANILPDGGWAINMPGNPGPQPPTFNHAAAPYTDVILPGTVVID